MNVGERIKKCRMDAGLSQEKLAEKLGVSRQAVTKWETGQSMPSTSNLFQLAEIFGTTVDFLTKKEITPTPQRERVIIKTAVVEKAPEENFEPKWLAGLKWVSLGCFIVSFFALIVWLVSYNCDNFKIMNVSAYITCGLMFMGFSCQLIRILGHINRKD